jgi:hypothetical protein
MYDTSTKRWLSEDPIGFEGGDTNLYRYVGNSPTNARDPHGFLQDSRRPPHHPKPPTKPVPPRENDMPGPGSRTNQYEKNSEQYEQELARLAREKKAAEVARRRQQYLDELREYERLTELKWQGCQLTQDEQKRGVELARKWRIDGPFGAP